MTYNRLQCKSCFRSKLQFAFPPSNWPDSLVVTFNSFLIRWLLFLEGRPTFTSRQKSFSFSKRIELLNSALSRNLKVLLLAEILLVSFLKLQKNILVELSGSKEPLWGSEALTIKSCETFNHKARIQRIQNVALWGERIRWKHFLKFKIFRTFEKS